MTLDLEMLLWPSLNFYGKVDAAWQSVWPAGLEAAWWWLATLPSSRIM